MGTWVNQNTALAPQAGVPTFASVAGASRDEPARQPLSVNAHLVLAPTDLAGIAAVFAQAQTVVTAEGSTLDNEHCRLVPNPWDPAVPNGVAVFVGAIMVGRLPADLEAAYCPPLAQLTSKGLLATAVADLWAGGARCGHRGAGDRRPARGLVALVIRPLVAALLAAAVALPAAPAEAGYTPMPYDPLPTSYEQLPLGPATTLAWWQANKLHAGGTTIRTRLHALAARAGTTVIGSGWSYPGRRSTAVVVRGGTTLVRLPIAGHIRGPEISADGHYIAWLDEQARTRIAEDLDRVRYRLVLYDATTFRVVADHRETREVEREDGINGLSLLSVANTGQALFTRSSAGPYVLAPGRRPVKVKGHLTQLRDWDGWPLGITTFRRRGGSDRGLFGTVSRRGRFHHVGTTQHGVRQVVAHGGRLRVRRRGRLPDDLLGGPAGSRDHRPARASDRS